MSLQTRIREFFSFSQPIASARTSEAVFPSGPGQDPDEHLWQPISAMGGALRKTRQLSDFNQSEMLNLAHWFYKGNPIGKRVVDITAEYSIGDGISFSAEDPAVQQILFSHWSDPTNNWSLNQFERARDLGLQGELFLPAFTNPANGHVSLGNIDPALVERVIDDPINNMKTHAVILRKLKGEEHRRAYKVINASEATNGESMGRLVGIPTTEEEKKLFGIPFMVGDKIEPAAHGLAHNFKAVWAGSIFYFRVNAPMTSNRGWSDLLSILDWMSEHDKLLFSQVTKAVESGKYMLDTTISGADEKRIREYMSKQTARKVGEQFAHNESVKNEFLTPNLHLEDIATFSSVLKNHILAGAGLPPIWFAESLTSRASAPEMTEPSFKHLRIRQRYLAYMIQTIFRYSLDQAILHGRLKQDSRRSNNSSADITSSSFYLKLPDISAKDQRMLAIATRNYAGALKDAIEMEILELADAKSMFRQYLEMNGLDSWKREPTFNQSQSSQDDLPLGDIFRKVAESGTLELSDHGNTYYVFPDPVKKVA